MRIIGIAGGTGSGKTTFAKSLRDMAPDRIKVISLDSFYRTLPEMLPCSIKNPKKAMELRTKNNYESYTADQLMDIFNMDHPESWNWDRVSDCLTALRRGETKLVPTYDYSRLNQCVSDFTCVDPSFTKILILEAIYAFYDKRVCEMLDLSIYLDIPSEIRLLRVVKRDCDDRGRTAANVMKNFIQTVKPYYDQYAAVTVVRADMVIPMYPNFKIEGVVSLAVRSFLAEDEGGDIMGAKPIMVDQLQMKTVL